MLADEWDEEALDREDTELVKLESGQTMSRSYTFSISAKLDGFISSDMHKLEVGKKYDLGLRPQRWRWMFAEDMPANVKGEREIAELLSKRDVSEWKPHCAAVFEAGE